MSAGWHKWALDINSTVITEMFLDWIKKYYIGNTIVIITFIIITIIIIVATITIIITFKFFFLKQEMSAKVSLTPWIFELLLVWTNENQVIF